ncbi:uncharacterized protein LOC113506005 [Trichoplusia ni]|uniref:Uncharacterized protein LOC113506005 n=1 Tax=Trichoplusia ni TaxID=7111 RepID=A0A7E5WV11_TRINI|nr:uncharacterized protein LOC113506005 [Trichoplusia ni]
MDAKLALNLEELESLFTAKMAAYEAKFATASFGSSSSSASTCLSQDFSEFKGFVLQALSKFKTQLELLSLGFDRHETTMRRKVLLIHGVPEAKDEKAVDVVAKVFNDNLKQLRARSRSERSSEQLTLTRFGSEMVEEDLEMESEQQVNRMEKEKNTELSREQQVLPEKRSRQEDDEEVIEDSKSALYHIARCASGRRGTPIAYEILSKIEELAEKGVDLRLQWVPSHIGIRGNEEADRLAKIGNNLKLSELSRENIHVCHRLGSGKRSRPLLVRFFTTEHRHLVWDAKKSLKGTGYTISEFLTRMRHQTFIAARKRFGMTNCWSSEGKIVIITPDKSRHKLESMEELQKLLL